MKRKQFIKGTSQIAQEGAIQIFQELGGGMEEVKAVAEYVTAPVMEDGIEKALAHFGLI